MLVLKQNIETFDGKQDFFCSHPTATKACMFGIAESPEASLLMQRLTPEPLQGSIEERAKRTQSTPSSHRSGVARNPYAICVSTVDKFDIQWLSLQMAAVENSGEGQLFVSALRFWSLFYFDTQPGCEQAS